MLTLMTFGIMFVSLCLFVATVLLISATIRRVFCPVSPYERAFQESLEQSVMLPPTDLDALFRDNRQ